MARKHVRAVRLGHAPNCSSAGSVVGAMLLTTAGAAVVLNVWADRFLRWAKTGGGGARLRGDGRLALDDAVLDLTPSGVEVARPHATALSGEGPTEAHLAVTGRCPVACDACYLDAGPHRAEPSVAALRRDLQGLAELGVLEIAFGGGEALLRSELVDLCQTTFDLGMVPNLTTSGFGVTPQLASRLAPLVGQVNVSLDGLGEIYVAARGWDGAERGLRAIRVLCDAGIRVGVNTVLSRPVWETSGALEALGEAIIAAGAVEWQWLRLKPTGRGAAVYSELAPNLDGLWLRLLRAETAGIVMRIDCALTPWLAAAGLDPAIAQQLGVRGCPGGDDLWARDPDGRWAPCSFAEGAPAVDLARSWETDEQLLAWRELARQPPEPCRSCDWHSVCRGGCRIVAGHLTGDPLSPDPECPRVVAWS